MPETSVIVGASLAIHFFTPQPATGGRAEGLGHRGGAKRRSEPPTVGIVGNSDPMIEADAPSTGSCSCTLNGVCAVPGEDIEGDVQWSRHELIYSSFLSELPRTLLWRSSQNSPSRKVGEYLLGARSISSKK